MTNTNTLSSLHLSSFCNNRSHDLQYLLSLQSHSEYQRQRSCNSIHLLTPNEQVKSRISNKTRSFRRFHLYQKRVSKHSSKRKRIESTCRRSRRRYLHLNIHKTKDCLVSHVWHSKRMHMEKLPNTSMTLPMRHSRYGHVHMRRLHDTKNNCLVHDMSYYRVIEISAESIIILIEAMSRFIDPSCEISMEKETTLLIYAKDCFPDCCIGPVTITPNISSKVVLFDYLIF